MRFRQRYARFWISTALALGAILAACPSERAAAQDAAAARQQYESQLEQWKSVLKDLRKLKVQYDQASETETPGLRAQWDALIQKGESLLPDLRAAAIAAYQAAPNEDRELMRFLVKLAGDDIDHDRYEAALELSDVLIENNCDDASVFTFGGIAAFATNDYDKAESYLNQAQSRGALQPPPDSPAPRTLGVQFLAQIDDYKKWWKEEQELRQAEAEADDLPRVKLTTTKGEIVLELFENEAPGTVGNFISLVEAEKPFYDGLTFHRVLSGFMAQGGCPVGNGSGGPGYEIYCECNSGTFRRHFRGSISMAHTGAPNTGGSQFFMMFVPRSHLDAKHTVFGRVIEGMDVLAEFKRGSQDENGSVTEPDSIIKAEVIRKRDHEYAPSKVQ